MESMASTSGSSNHYCCVPKCNSWAKKDSNHEISFHLFPPESGQKVYMENAFGKELIERRKAWILKLRIGKAVTKYMKVCSLHFKEEDYLNKGSHTKKGRILKKTAVPSENLPTGMLSEPSTSTSSTRVDRYKKRITETVVSGESGDQPQCEDELNHSEAEVEAARGLLKLLNSNQNICGSEINSVLNQGQDKLNIQVRDSQVQVNTYRMTTLCDLLNTETALSSFTGVNNFEIIKCLEHMICKELHDTRSHRLTVKERLILTLTKLKLDLSYVTLAALFNISNQLCKTYFFDMLSVLSKILKNCIYFPSSEEISANLPKCFKNFPNCRVILDCTEMTIQKPTCLCCRIKFYSQYKRNLTVKFMTGVSPAGLITFVSAAYGGRALDKIIFEESNLMNKLCPNKDALMVDKGFLIDEISAIYKIKLIRPPFLQNKKQLSAEEALINQQIASARVHIERSNQRLKVFKIFNGKLQWYLVPKIDEIITILCGLTNLSASILSDERF